MIFYAKKLIMIILRDLIIMKQLLLIAILCPVAFAKDFYISPAGLRLIKAGLMW